jgi:hypothetical protein
MKNPSSSPLVIILKGLMEQKNLIDLEFLVNSYGLFSLNSSPPAAFLLFYSFFLLKVKKKPTATRAIQKINRKSPTMLYILFLYTPLSKVYKSNASGMVINTVNIILHHKMMNCFLLILSLPQKKLHSYIFILLASRRGYFFM